MIKTPDFWYQTSPSPLAHVLRPLAWLWQGGAALRRMRAFPQEPLIPTLCIGNSVVGGGGKTPLVRAVTEILRQRGHRPVIVTRGYGGTLRTPTLVDPHRHTAHDVGDEALMLAGGVFCAHASSTLAAGVPIVVARNRAEGVRLAATHGGCAVLDDGLQNPTLRAHASLLVVNGADGFGNRLVCPAGPLRESLEMALSRVAAVVIVGEDTYGVRTLLPKTLPVFWATPSASLPETLSRGTRILAFAGIARPERFLRTCESLGLVIVDWQAFPDHYWYSGQDIAALSMRARAQNLRLVTTEKDKARLTTMRGFDTNRTDEDIAVVRLSLDLRGAEAEIVRLLFP